MTAPTERFSSRVDNYVKYRPSYPPEVVDLLAGDYGLTPASAIADVGSGTGLLSELFLRNGNQVYGVEPNKEMREAGERLLAGYPNFISVSGTAEATTLADSAVDFITAGQAFHWFDLPAARREFARILRPGGWIVLIWNLRLDNTPFLQDYEALLQTYATDYNQVNHRNQGPDDISAFFGPAGCSFHALPNAQYFDLAGLSGRIFSSSYTPQPGHPSYEPMVAAIGELFDRHQRDGSVTFAYETQIFVGRLSDA